MAEADVMGTTEVRTKYRIIVNTRTKIVHQQVLAFAEVVELAFPGAHGTDVTFTITYHHAIAPLHEGNLSEGGQVTVKDGTIFDVTRTTRS